MKFALNGALTIGTLDGANVEIRDAVGADNFFLFGLTADEVDHRRRAATRRALYEANAELREAIDQIAGFFANGDRELFRPLVDRPARDDYMLLADYQAYIDCQQRVSAAYRDENAGRGCRSSTRRESAASRRIARSAITAAISGTSARSGQRRVSYVAECRGRDVSTVVETGRTGTDDPTIETLRNRQVKNLLAGDARGRHADAPHGRRSAPDAAREQQRRRARQRVPRMTPDVARWSDGMTSRTLVNSPPRFFYKNI